MHEEELKGLKPLDIANLACQIALAAGGPVDATTQLDQAIDLVQQARTKLNQTVRDQRPP